MTSGYYSEAYARSFAPSPVVGLPASGGWLLQREIAGTDRSDLMGLYPFLCCRDWTALSDDLSALPGDPVSLVTVTDPLGRYDASVLAGAFATARPYKDHFVIDTSVPLADHVKRSHREVAGRAMRRVDVSIAESPMLWADDWVRLYGVLCTRHAISGVRRFSEAALRAQLAVEGLVMFRASLGSRTIGLDLWYLQDDAAQGHLAAFDEDGYRLRASYATKMVMIESLRQRVAWINLGGAPGSGEGLLQFKRGFATGTRTAWLCSRIFDPAVYSAITAARGIAPDTAFFPAYRNGEIF